MLRPLLASLLISAALIAPPPQSLAHDTGLVEVVKPVAWSDARDVDVAAINADLVAGRPTVDVAIYVPSNFDPDFDKVDLPAMIAGFREAKRIYAPAGLQLNLLWARTGAIDPRFLAIQSNEIPRIPETEYANMYVNARRHPAEMTSAAKAAFESMVEASPDNRRTIYLIALQDVIFPFLEVSEGRNWTVKMVRTGGLSFPSYSYLNTMPDRLRGVITLTNLSTEYRRRHTIAHEIGHKVMNVSHEYMTTDPAHEVRADGGLMLYGAGEDIPSGAQGRWHRERLLLSPYVYRRDADGTRRWNSDYVEGGHYYDPIYGQHVVHFQGKAPMDPDW